MEQNTAMSPHYQNSILKDGWKWPTALVIRYLEAATICAATAGSWCSQAK